jgi:hypothetical protein
MLTDPGSRGASNGPLLRHGAPRWFQLSLALIELVLPPVYVWLAPADERQLGVEPRGNVLTRDRR